jgi:16S rRNA (guanine966-N2)-methyltransferase
MDKQKPPTDTTPKPFNQNRSYKKDGEKPYQAKRFLPGDNQFQSQPERFQNRDETTQRRDGKPRSGAGKFQSRDGKFQPKNPKLETKNNRFQPNVRFNRKDKNFKPWATENLPPIVSDMQITDGKHRGRYLQSTASPKIRPTTRRMREVMFRILFRRVRAGRFLDLCAGCGMVGIEAISRGALLGTFVERSAKMCSFIKTNLEACGIKPGHGEIVEMEAVPFLKQMQKRRRFWDIVYFDPPLDTNYDEVLAFFNRGTTLKPHGVLVIEHHAEMFFPEKFGVMNRWRVLVQGDKALSFYERR